MVCFERIGKKVREHGREWEVRESEEVKERKRERKRERKK